MYGNKWIVSYKKTCGRDDTVSVMKNISSAFSLGFIFPPCARIKTGKVIITKHFF